VIVAAASGPHPRFFSFLPEGDAGAGSLLVVAILGAVVSVALLSASASAALVSRTLAAGAADAAALAAADAAVGIRGDAPCEAAGLLAAANGAVLLGCSVDGLVVTVEVSAGTGMAAARALATAGPRP